MAFLGLSRDPGPCCTHPQGRSNPLPLEPRPWSPAPWSPAPGAPVLVRAFSLLFLTNLQAS